MMTLIFAQSGMKEEEFNTLITMSLKKAAVG